MTNKENAKKLALKLVNADQTDAYDDLTNLLVEMAELKEEEFRKYLKDEYAKVRKEMKERYGMLNEYQNGCYDGRAYELTDIFKEYLGGDAIEEEK